MIQWCMIIFQHINNESENKVTPLHEAIKIFEIMTESALRFLI